MDIECGGVLDISVASQWWQQALPVLQTSAAVNIKASDIQRIDAAGIQAILSLINTANKRNISITLSDPSPALCEAARLTGLNKELMLD